MSDANQADQFAAELTQRFEDWTQWAIQHWPHHDFPLMTSDFAQSRRELNSILGAKLDAGQQSATSNQGPDESGQYIDSNPMPWP